MRRSEKEKSSIVVHSITMPKDLNARFNKLFADPIFDRIVYGSRSRIICAILKEYLDDIESGRRKFDPNIF